MDNLAIEAAEAAVGAGYPLDAEGLLIVELEGEKQQVAAESELLLEVVRRSKPYLEHIASDPDDRMRIWKGRKSAFSAVGRLSSDYIVQDGVVPRSRLGEALTKIQHLGEQHGIRVANVFHAGDGNLHPLILFDGRVEGELERAEELAGEILRLCIDLGGSITGEHGVGMEKRQYLGEMFGEADLDAMRRIRLAIDPGRAREPGQDVPGRRSAVAAEPRSASAGSGGRDLARMSRGGAVNQGSPGDSVTVVVHRPASAAEVAETVRGAELVVPRGGGTKPALWSVDGADVLDVLALNGITEYLPSEYTVTALAGTPLADVEARLAAEGQYLPFDPLLVDAGSTVGGAVAAGANGPGRLRYGGLRDFLLAVTFVDGRGEIVRGGARVVKNAAGFDLPKLMVGSLGRLGVAHGMHVQGVSPPGELRHPARRGHAARRGHRGRRPRRGRRGRDRVPRPGPWSRRLGP